MQNWPTFGLCSSSARAGGRPPRTSPKLPAATYGAIQYLLIDIDEVLPGTLDENGAVTFASAPSAATYDIVDEIAGRAMLSGARVLAVRRADLPGQASLAAMMRYAF